MGLPYLLADISAIAFVFNAVDQNNQQLPEIRL